MDDWYTAVCALPTVWPDVSMMGISNLRKVVGYDFHHIWKKCGVPGMWGNVRPRWRLLQQHVEATGPGWYSVAEREERLFTNRSNQPGDDMKDEVRTDDDWHGWRIWSTTRDHCSFLVRKESLRASMPRSERKSVLYRYSFLEVSKVSTSRKKKRKQVEDAPSST